MADPLPDDGPRQLQLLETVVPEPPEAPSVVALPVAVRQQPFRMRIPWLRIAVVALAVALIGTAFWGYQTNQTLSTTQQDLATANSKLASLGAQLDAATTRGNALSNQVTTLQTQVQGEDTCISALAAEGKLLGDVNDKETTLNNLTATGSVWAKANTARNTALYAGLNDYYNAFSAAWDGARTTANSWIDKGNAQIDAAGKDLDSMDGQIALANQMVAEIQGMLEEYSGNDLAACGISPTPSSGPNA